MIESQLRSSFRLFSMSGDDFGEVLASRLSDLGAKTPVLDVKTSFEVYLDMFERVLDVKTSVSDDLESF